MKYWPMHTNDPTHRIKLFSNADQSSNITSGSKGGCLSNIMTTSDDNTTIVTIHLCGVGSLNESSLFRTSSSKNYL